MPRTATAEPNKQPPNGQQATPPPPAPRTLEEHLAWVEALHAAGTDLRPVAHNLFREKFALQGALAEIRQLHEKLREEIETLVEPERYPAVITAVNLNGEVTAEVHVSGTLLEVAVHPDIDPAQLRVGARGILSKGRNCLLHLQDRGPRWQEVGTFEGHAADGRILLRHQEQLVAALVTDDLAQVELRKGDLVGFDRDGARLAYARVEPPGREDLFFETTPQDRF